MLSVNSYLKQHVQKAPFSLFCFFVLFLFFSLEGKGGDPMSGLSPFSLVACLCVVCPFHKAAVLCTAKFQVNLLPPSLSFLLYPTPYPYPRAKLLAISSPAHPSFVTVFVSQSPTVDIKNRDSFNRKLPEIASTFHNEIEK